MWEISPDVSNMPFVVEYWDSNSSFITAKSKMLDSVIGKSSFIVQVVQEELTVVQHYLAYAYCIVVQCTTLVFPPLWNPPLGGGLQRGALGCANELSLRLLSRDVGSTGVEVKHIASRRAAFTGEQTLVRY